MKKIFLKDKKDAAVRRFHPWVFSGAVLRASEPVSDGETVEVVTHKGEYLATGHYHDGSICVRIFSFQHIAPGEDIWLARLSDARQYRRELGLLDDGGTDCYRLVHAEGDGLPGLIIDVYGHTAVLQCHSVGMHLERDKIAAALRSMYGEALRCIYDKSADTLPDRYASTVQNGYLYGEGSAGLVRENGHAFHVNWETGQKTGFFLDQRDNRALLARYAPGKTVLNAFCYSGGFSVYALAAGAERVDSVDVSAKAMALTAENVTAGGFPEEQHRAYTVDVMTFLQAVEEPYDLMVVDPPAFAKSIGKRHNAVQGYKRLNALAMSRLRPGGILFTFSCSQVVDEELFYNTIVAAALEAGRQVRVMHRLSQPADHPVSFYHPEGAYLKGLVLYVV